MPQVDFDQLPENARVWIFSSQRTLSELEQRELLNSIDTFIEDWGSHDKPLTAGRTLRYERFLFVAVDQREIGPSGCSIDSLVRQIKVLGNKFGVDFIDRAQVIFRQGMVIKCVPRKEFSDLVVMGQINLETTVFDNSLTRLGDVRAGRWETRAADTWHARAFFE